MVGVGPGRKEYSKKRRDFTNKKTKILSTYSEIYVIIPEFMV